MEILIDQKSIPKTKLVAKIMKKVLKGKSIT